MSRVDPSQPSSRPSPVSSSLAPPSAGTGNRLVLNSPLSGDSLGRLLGVATAREPARVVDHGCGWGEVLLRALERVPAATGFGVDLHQPDIDRAKAAATARGLAERVELVGGDSRDHRQQADLQISLGAYQAFGDIPTALRELRADVADHGRLLFGAEYWTELPREDELAHMWPGASVADCLDAAAVVGAALDVGWRVLDLYDSTRTEFDDFEVGHRLEREEWLLEHPDHEIRTEMDASWTAWLRGHRRPMGFLTLVLAAA